MSDSYFSTTYAEARRRFTDAARTVGANVHSYKVDSAPPDDLTIDVAVLGSDDAPALVVSSGVHGVEGFFGSAVQLALLDRLNDANPRKNIRYVLIHGINPYGFAHLRRCNEDNVDLNRNFLIDTDSFAGAPDNYPRLDGFLNPRSRRWRFVPFKPKLLLKLRLLWYAKLIGPQELEEAIMAGQYEYPLGLSFGGKDPCKSTQIVQDNCDSWLPASQKIMHIDFHTGLGPFASYELLLTELSSSEHFDWYADTFGADCVERAAQFRRSGLFDEWMQSHFCERDYRIVCAEFGTYNPVRILFAMRAENRVHHHYPESSWYYRRAKKELKKCFCPTSRYWRRRAVESGLRIIDQGIQALSTSDSTPDRSASPPATAQAESIGRYVSDREETARHAASKNVDQEA